MRGQHCGERTVSTSDSRRRPSPPIAWTAAEIEYRQPDGSTVWQVEASRNEHRVLAWGRTRGDAWKAAERILRRVQSGR
jgi:hypothetical protein